MNSAFHNTGCVIGAYAFAILESLVCADRLNVRPTGGLALFGCINPQKLMLPNQRRTADLLHALTVVILDMKF